MHLSYHGGFGARAHASARSAQISELELVLAIDVSGSVDREEFARQINWPSAAFRSEDIIHLIKKTGQRGAIHVTVAQWSGEPHQAQAVPWTRLLDRTSALSFTEAIDGTRRRLKFYSNAIGNALVFSRQLFAQRPGTCRRRVVDVSGDGASNEGPGAGAIRDWLVAENVTVNGLGIRGSQPELDQYYRDNVIGGEASFLITAESFRDFPAAVRRKLLREIAPPIS
ncbi:MAG: DUF1194 domain-containing protein [Pseudomonadota bacterium]